MTWLIGGEGMSYQIESEDKADEYSADNIHDVAEVGGVPVETGGDGQHQEPLGHDGH